MEVDGGMETHFSNVVTPSVNRRRKIHKSEKSLCLSPMYTAYLFDENKRHKVDHRDPFAVRDWVIGLDDARYGSVTKEIEDLFSTKKQMLMPYLKGFPSLRVDSVELKPGKDSSAAHNDTKHGTNGSHMIIIIDSDDDEAACIRPSLLNQDVSNEPIGRFSTKQILGEDNALDQASKGAGDAINVVEPSVVQDRCVDHDDAEGDMVTVTDRDDIERDMVTVAERDDIEGDMVTVAERDDTEGDMVTVAERDDTEGDIVTVAEPNVSKEKIVEHVDVGGGDTIIVAEPNVLKEKIVEHVDVGGRDTIIVAEPSVGKDKSVEHDDTEGESKHNKGVYVGVEDEDEDTSMEESDGLMDIWKEMTIGLESLKDINPSHNECASEDGEECDHSFILKEDIGYVCRVCGIIERSIESIIEFQRPKRSKSTRTYYHEGQTRDAAGPILDGVKLPGTNFSGGELFAHPRHQKQMKPHQVDGFNFLLSNLVSENPGGCILAHAPGSGKTFLLISFIQCFMAKYPDAKPLVILPRGILPTWKKEFTRWQVEEIPLFDFYTVKADGRSQQLEVLKQWANQRSILFLGYQQFSSIVCDNDTSSTSVSCQEILMTYPSILILDEGHTPRNQDTNMFTSLEKVQTPRKVILSGTLFQNHVKEVFNILNLVRPKFLKMEDCKVIKKRILSRVLIESRRNLVNTDNEFYEEVENTLLKDDNFKRKVSVIEDLREMTRKVLHYYKGDFLDELPGLVDFSVFLNLSPKQKREISELRKLARKFKISSDGSAIYVHPHLKSLTGAKDRNDDNTSKIDELVEKVDWREGVKGKFYLNMLRLCESGGEKLLVFSQYLLPLKFLVRLTMKVNKGWSLNKEIFMITGDHVIEEREIAMDQFNNSPESRVFFGSIKACGEGISFVGASRIIILDVHLNPSVTRQAIGRAFRPGQVRKVYAYRLVAAHSPEEEDHMTCFKKESISKMWFEWNDLCGHKDFEMEATSIEDCGDEFLETSSLNQDITAIYKR